MSTKSQLNMKINIQIYIKKIRGKSMLVPFLLSLKSFIKIFPFLKEVLKTKFPEVKRKLFRENYSN